MPRWSKKEGEEEGKEIEVGETPLEKEVAKEESNGAQQAYKEKLYEVAYLKEDGLKWASNLLGAIHRALEYRENVAVREQDTEQLQFYMTVLSYIDVEALAKVFLELEQKERAKVENDVSVS